MKPYLAVSGVLTVAAVGGWVYCNVTGYIGPDGVLHEPFWLIPFGWLELTVAVLVLGFGALATAVRLALRRRASS